MDAVAGCHARVAGEDGEVGAANAEGGAAVVGIAVGWISGGKLRERYGEWGWCWKGSWNCKIAYG